MYDSRVVIYESRAFIRLTTAYFLLQSQGCMLETCMLLAGPRVNKHLVTSLKDTMVEVGGGELKRN